MTDDMLLAFRARSDPWADRARAEAKIIQTSIADPTAKSATGSFERLGFIIEHIHAACDHTIVGIAKLSHERKAEIGPDEEQEFDAITDDIIALKDEMDGLVRTIAATLDARMKHDRP
jgi:hypothetical protein